MNDDQHYKSLHERISYVVGIAAIPAISVMVFTRTQLGFRQINIFRQLVVTVFLLVFSSSSRLSINIPFVPSYQGSVSPVLGFVVAMLAAGWWQKKIYKKNNKLG